MSLEPLMIYDFQLDTQYAYPLCVEYSLHRGDWGLAHFRFKLTKGIHESLDITGWTPKLTYKSLNDYTRTVYEAQALSVDYVAGIVTFKVEQQMTAKVGTLQLQLVLTKEDGSKYSFPRANITIEQCSTISNSPTDFEMGGVV